MANIILPEELRYIKKILVYDELGSTNDVALKLEKSGEPSGTLIVALKQKAGRGRMSRPWLMAEGDIAATLFLRAPHLPLFELPKLAWLPALSVIEALQELNVIAKLKWPNDIVIDPGTGLTYDYFGAYLKIGGVLVENIFKDQKVAASALGFGINVHANPDLKARVPHAGSLAQVKANMSSADLWPLLIKRLDKNLHRLLAPDGGAEIYQRYVPQCLSLGQSVSVYIGAQQIVGKAIGLSAAGFLVVDDGNKHHLIYGGDVNIQI